MSYVLTFERIGRNHNVPDLTTDQANPDAIAEEVWRLARKNCGSRDLEVVIDLEEMKGFIYAGMRNAGRFTITEATHPAPEVRDGS